MTVQEIVDEVNKQANFMRKIGVKPKKVWLGKQEIDTLKNDEHVQHMIKVNSNVDTEVICGLDIKRSILDTQIEVITS